MTGGTAFCDGWDESQLYVNKIYIMHIYYVLLITMYLKQWKVCIFKTIKWENWGIPAKMSLLGKKIKNIFFYCILQYDKANELLYHKTATVLCFSTEFYFFRVLKCSIGAVYGHHVYSSYWQHIFVRFHICWKKHPSFINKNINQPKKNSYPSTWTFVPPVTVTGGTYLSMSIFPCSSIFSVYYQCITIDPNIIVTFTKPINKEFYIYS